MPMTVKGSPLSEIVLPMTPGSLPNRRVQSPWLITATFSPPGRSSSRRERAPADDRRAEQLEVVRADLRRPELLRGAAARVVDDVVRKAATSSTTAVCWRQCDELRRRRGGNLSPEATCSST